MPCWPGEVLEGNGDRVAVFCNNIKGSNNKMQSIIWGRIFYWQSTRMDAVFTEGAILTGKRMCQKYDRLDLLLLSKDEKGSG